ncbi:hypothetical protein NE237_024775 [Protea cynaroides]|uniref:RNase H type-1 domain-containing protein n=1 Tax=Protea cynaroides TaxID=273540 RepID=A0A9Q0JYV3_9MAGN|nr:hypothetical protein NE237_024775 [Protea cynaroides]
MCWTLWKAKNKFYFDNIDCNPFDVIHKAERAWKEFIAIDFLVKSTQHFGWLKLNSDEAFTANPISHGIGYIIRNTGGAPLNVVSQTLSFLLVAIEEALVIREGILEALKISFSQLVIEFDCLGIFNLIKGVTQVGEVLLRLLKLSLIKGVL